MSSAKCNPVPEENSSDDTKREPEIIILRSCSSEAFVLIEKVIAALNSFDCITRHAIPAFELLSNIGLDWSKISCPVMFICLLIEYLATGTSGTKISGKIKHEAVAVLTKTILAWLKGDALNLDLGIGELVKIKALGAKIISPAIYESLLRLLTQEINLDCIIAAVIMGLNNKNIFDRLKMSVEIKNADGKSNTVACCCCQ